MGGVVWVGGPPNNLVYPNSGLSWVRLRLWFGCDKKTTHINRTHIRTYHFINIDSCKVQLYCYSQLLHIKCTSVYTTVHYCTTLQCIYTFVAHTLCMNKFYCCMCNWTPVSVYMYCKLVLTNESKISIMNCIGQSQLRLLGIHHHQNRSLIAACWPPLFEGKGA